MIEWIIAALFAGMLVPVQNAANARLRMSVGTPRNATMLSFALSTAVLCGIASLLTHQPLPTLSAIAAAPWWTLTGGLIAVFNITLLIRMFRELGQLETIVLPLFGQLAFSLVIDGVGLFGAARIPVTPLRVAAILVAGTGVLILTANGRSHPTAAQAASPTRNLWRLAAIAVGCLIASIGEIYGTLGVRLGSALSASLVSFLIATAAIFAICAADRSLFRVQDAFLKPAPWWMWLGGLCGAVNVYATSKLIPVLGTGAFFTAFLSGQMIFSLALDHFGGLGATKHRAGLRQAAGISLMLGGAALIRF